MSLFVSLTPDMDDETLFAKVERGDVEAFTVVYNKYHKLLYVLAYRYLMDKAMAEEAERLGSNLSEHWYSCFDIMRLFGLGKTQVRRFALTHGVRTKRIHGNRLYYLKADWDAARKIAERKSASTKAKREQENESDNN